MLTTLPALVVASPAEIFISRMLTHDPMYKNQDMTKIEAVYRRFTKRLRVMEYFL